MTYTLSLWRGLAGLLLASSPALLHAATLNVPASAYPTIQSGVDAAHDGDIVLVAGGTYTGNGNRDIDFHGKSLTVRSAHGPAKTIIDCGGHKSANGSGNHRGFYLHSSEKKATISGFTIRNGYEKFATNVPDSGYGGGLCNHNRRGILLIINCSIASNTAQSSGGYGGGGGVYNYNQNNGGMITLFHCTVSNNIAQHVGGSVYNLNQNGGGSTLLTNCVSFGNLAKGNVSPSNGSGSYNFNQSIDGRVLITNCIFYRDSGPEIVNDFTTVLNAAAAFSDIQGGYPGTNNITADPRFVDAAASDFRLKPNSPCVGKGTSHGAPSADKNGKKRPNPPSMGAYE